MADPVRILIIDDAEDDAVLLERELVRQGMAVIKCERVENAKGLRQALKGGPFDIVLCDYVLPGFAAEEALALLRELDFDVPFIVISGVVRTADVVEVLRSGADDFVEKDDLSRLGPAIERALRGVQVRRERQQAEEKLRQSQKLETIGQLTGGLAHDLNNNLTIIRGNLGFVRDSVGDLPELKTIENATSRSADLVQRLLSFARKQHLDPGPVDTVELLAGLKPLMASSLGKSVELQLKVSGVVSPAFVDSNLLENAFLNLTLNASDAMPEGGVFTIGLANVSIDDANNPDKVDLPAGEYLQVSVKDDGLGMPADILEHALEPFFTTKDVGEGSGLGLSMVYGFVRQSGGDLHIESNDGRGTELRMYLPVGNADAVPRDADRQPAAPVGEVQGNGKHVLVLEDDRTIRAFVVRSLEERGFHVHEAATADEATGILEREDSIDLLVSDVNLPGGKSGPEMYATARLFYPALKVVFVSGYVSTDAVNRIITQTSGRMLHKPFHADDLAKVVGEVLSAG